VDYWKELAIPYTPVGLEIYFLQKQLLVNTFNTGHLKADHN
jgi:hypothetical protein